MSTDSDSIADLFSDTQFGQALVDRGREEGREEGREQGRLGLLTGLLRGRFGDSPTIPDAAHALAGLPDDEAIASIAAASSLTDLTG